MQTFIYNFTCLPIYISTRIVEARIVWTRIDKRVEKKDEKKKQDLTVT